MSHEFTFKESLAWRIQTVFVELFLQRWWWMQIEWKGAVSNILAHHNRPPNVWKILDVSCPVPSIYSTHSGCFFYYSILTSQNREALVVSPVETLLSAESQGSHHLHLNSSPENGWKIYWIHDRESAFQLCSKRELRQVRPEPNQYKKPVVEVNSINTLPERLSVSKMSWQCLLCPAFL